MPEVVFAGHLCHQFPVPASAQATGNTVRQIIADLDTRYPGLSHYLLDDQRALRQHVNVFVGNQLVRDRQELSDLVPESEKMHVMPALSGG